MGSDIEQDGNGGQDTATVSVTISPVNDPPTAVDDSASTNEDTAVSVDVLANDSDPDGDALSVSSVGSMTNGVAQINPDNTVHVPILNGDISFLNAIAHVLLKDHDDVIDWEFIKAHANGWDTYVDGVLNDYSPE